MGRGGGVPMMNEQARMETVAVTGLATGERHEIKPGGYWHGSYRLRLKGRTATP